MYSFKNDYSEGIHPNILKAMVEANLVQTDGYGEDDYCAQAASIIKSRLNDSSVDIHFVSGGTQANIICLSSMLKTHEAVIATTDGHIFTHETGAIEATGHKVIACQSNDGKLTPALIQQVVFEHPDYHMVKPRVVFISNSTEIGTVYTLEELYALKECCIKNNLLLYMDGARFGTALTAANNNVSMSELTKIFDAFYIGGTKNGALFGEAIVIVNEALKADFKYIIKQKGALLAKGKFLGIQFIELFKEDLFLQLAAHANKMGMAIHEAFLQNGYSLYIDSTTNQQFPIIPNELLPRFDEKYSTSVWCPYDENHTVLRFVTSWATPEQKVVELINDIKSFRG